MPDMGREEQSCSACGVLCMLPEWLFKSLILATLAGGTRYVGTAATGCCCSFKPCVGLRLATQVLFLSARSSSTRRRSSCCAERLLLCLLSKLTHIHLHRHKLVCARSV
jgi:hypothetical protein